MRAAAAAIQVDVEGARVRIPPTAAKLAGFRAWVTSRDFPDQGVRATFVDGEVVLDMSPESIESHNKVKLAVTADVLAYVRKLDLGEVYVDGALLTNIRAGVSTEPDLCFASWETLKTARLRLKPRAGRTDEFIELVGTPDLVVEIVSDSSEDKDLRRLRSAYARAAIPEYWLIDARGDRLTFAILRLVRGKYQPAPPGRPQRSRALGATFRLYRDRNRAGRWSYHLSTTAR
jgi:Uma2 family endonuclease